MCHGGYLPRHNIHGGVVSRFMSNLDKKYLEIVKGIIQDLINTRNQGSMSFSECMKSKDSWVFRLKLPHVVSKNRKLDIKIYLDFHEGKLIEVETLGVHWTMSTT